MKSQFLSIVYKKFASFLCSIFLLFLLNSFSVHAAPNIPLNFDGWIIETLAKLEVSGVTGGFHRHSLPLSRADVANIIQRAEARIRSGTVTVSPIDRKLLEKLKREFHFELARTTQRTDIRIQPELRVADNKIAPALQSGLHYAVGNNKHRLSVYSELELSNFEQGSDFIESFFLPDPPPLLKSADQRYERWRGDYVVDFKRSYLQYHLMPFGDAELDLLVGRDFVFWGASAEKSVGISDNSPPFELIRLTGTFPCKIGTLKATAFSAQLNSTWFDDGTMRYLAKRYLSAHRLDYQFSDWLEIGAAEWVLYGGDVQTAEWNYLNPVIPYYAVQYNAKKDDNIMFSLDGAVRPMDGVRLYAEWVADDFQYNPDTFDPHAVTWLIGVEWYPIQTARQLGIHTEYVRVNRWAYTHLVPDNQFTHFGAVIGHPIGTDADIFTLHVTYQATPSAVIESRFSHQRNGEADITDRFYGEEYQDIPFPSGVVERLSEIRIGWKYRPITGLKGSVNYAWRHIQNSAHAEGETEQQHRFVFLFAYAWGN